MDIAGYHLYDAANKNYIMPASTIILSHENIRFLYATTKIVLNNNGNESITLTDATGMIIGTESYSGTQRDNVVIYLMTTDDSCRVISPIENTTGTTNSGTSSTISQNNNSTGGTNTGTSSIGS